MDNYWLSRRPKLTAEQLFSMARQHLLSNDFRTAMNLLKYCVDHDEATWLLELLIVNGGEKGEPIGFLSARHWLEYIFRSSNHPYAVKYRLCFSNADKPGEFEEALALANNGEVLAQYCLGRYYTSHGVNFAKSDFWHSKAAAQDSVESGYELLEHQITCDDDGIIAESLKYVLPFFRVASEGSIDAMDLLLRL